jgi:hypothetical protein
MEEAQGTTGERVEHISTGKPARVSRLSTSAYNGSTRATRDRAALGCILPWWGPVLERTHGSSTWGSNRVTRVAEGENTTQGFSWHPAHVGETIAERTGKNLAQGADKGHNTDSARRV